MRGATWTQKLRSTVTRGALLVGAGAATFLGWSGWVATETVSGATNAQPSVLVCQATGDGEYVLVRVLSERLDEYRRNPNNLIPAPPDGCPATVRSGEGSVPTTTAPPTQPPATTSVPATTPSPSTPPATTSASRAAPTSKMPRLKPPPSTSIASRATSPPSGAVSPETTSGGSTPRRPKTYTGTVPADLKRLPNTGNETALLLFLGADLLLLGTGLRLRSRRSALMP